MSADDNVLIVEDEDEWCRIFMRAVSAEGPRATVKVANDQASAEELVATTKFALAIVDVGLDVSDDRNVDGLHVMSKIRDVGDKTSILVVTGRSGQDALLVARNALLEYQAYDTVGKSSVVPSKLRELVKQGLTAYRDSAVSTRTDARDAICGDMKPAVWDDRVMREIRFQGDVGKFYGFLNDLVGGYLPLVPRDKDEPVRIDGGTGFVAGQFWSRAIGAAILICFGAADGFAEARQASCKLMGEPDSIKEVKSHGVEGTVFALANSPRGEFGVR